MTNLSIEEIYSKLDKQIKLAEGYAEIKNLSFIIKSCRLKPYDYVYGEKSRNIVLYKKWIDEFGNSLNLIKSNKIKVVMGDRSISKDSITTDLYYGLSLNKIAKISKLIYCCYGKDEDTQQDCCIISFLGVDNYFRSYLYLYGEWKQVSTLMIGINNLKLLVNSLDIKHFQKFSKKENTPIPCISPGTWLSFMPPSDELFTLVEKECDYLIPILK